MTYGADDLGTMFDGVLGQAYNDTRLISLAVSHGYDIWADNDGDIWAGMTQDAREAWSELDFYAGEALQCLNDEACEPGYSFEWVDGDLMLTEHRQDNCAVVSISAETLDTQAEGDGELDTSAYALTTVRVAFPNSENGYTDTPQAFDWLNSVTVDFDAADGFEQVSFYASTGDPRGAMRIATLTRRADGSITLEAPSAYYLTSHEHYAAPAGAETVPAIWKVR